MGRYFHSILTFVNSKEQLQTRTMIAKASILLCLVAFSHSTILKKVVGYPTPIYTYRHIPEVHEFVAQPVVHKIVHPVHVENVVQPVVHTLYKSPVLHHSVESPVLEPQPAVPAFHEEVPTLVVPEASGSVVINKK